MIRLRAVPAVVAVSIILANFSVAHAAALVDHPSRAGVIGIEVDNASFAGYEGFGAEGGHLEATFTVPRFSCDPGPYASDFIALFAWRDFGDPEESFINGGGGVRMVCEEGGEHRYDPVLWDALGNEIAATATPVRARDKFMVTYVADEDLHTARATIENLTRGGSDSVETSFFPTDGLSIGDHVPQGYQRVPYFSKHTVRPVIVDGQPLTKSLGLTRYDVADGQGNKYLIASAIKKSGFKITREYHAGPER